MKNNIEFIEMSRTQQKYSGINPIFNDKTKFFKFLHYSFSKQSDCIIVCIDNDEDELDKIQFPRKRYTILQEKIQEFIDKYNETVYLGHYPSIIITIPVETIEYWILAGLCKTTDKMIISDIERKPKVGMKEKVYGRKNISPVHIFNEAVDKAISKSITTENINTKLIHLKSFNKFHKTLKNM